MPRFDSNSLIDWVQAVFEAAGVGSTDARTAASVLVRTNLRGIDTHGVMRVADYIPKILTREINPAGKPVTKVEGGVLHIDGDGALGQVVGTRAVAEAVELARTSAFVPCLIRRSGHLAALGQFTLQVAEGGMVGFMCQETPPLMSPPGARAPAIGNNPIAYSIPRGKDAPLVFDMAASTVSRGAVLAAANAGKPIPLEWAIDRDGQPTTDPAKALEGSMLPMAGHKGIGLAMLVQCLAGSLTLSNAVATAARNQSRSSSGNVSAFMLVINPELIVGHAAFQDHVDGWMGVYREAVGDQGRYPGERAARCEEERRVAGIPLADNVVASLKAVGERVKVSFDLLTIS